MIISNIYLFQYVERIVMRTTHTERVIGLGKKEIDIAMLEKLDLIIGQLAQINRLLQSDIGEAVIRNRTAIAHIEFPTVD
jgi:hypothetical protein